MDQFQKHTHGDSTNRTFNTEHRSLTSKLFGEAYSHGGHSHQLAEGDTSKFTARSNQHEQAMLQGFHITHHKPERARTAGHVAHHQEHHDKSKHHPHAEHHHKTKHHRTAEYYHKNKHQTEVRGKSNHETSAPPHVEPGQQPARTPGVVEVDQIEM
jgi:hypothetical protein